QTRGGIIQPREIAIGTEHHRRTVRLLIDLEAFENFLAVMENDAGWRKRKRAVRNDLRRAPFTVFVMLNQHVRSERGSERRTGLFACHYGILSVQIARQNNTLSPVVLPIALAISWGKA